MFISHQFGSIRANENTQTLAVIDMITQAYFTFADKITQDRMGERTNEDKLLRVERNLKAALLINESVVFRAYSVVESVITQTIIHNNIGLLGNGLLVPEFREGNEVLRKQVDRYLPRSTPKAARQKSIEMAEFLDGLKTKIEVDAEKLSKSRSECLALLLFRLVLSPNEYLKSNVNPDESGAYL